MAACPNDGNFLECCARTAMEPGVYRRCPQCAASADPHACITQASQQPPNPAYPYDPYNPYAPPIVGGDPATWGPSGVHVCPNTTGSRFPILVPGSMPCPPADASYSWGLPYKRPGGCRF